MNSYDDPNQGLAPNPNSFDNLAQQSGLVDAINQENFENHQERMPENYEEGALGEDDQFHEEPPQEPDEYDGFVEEEIVEEAPRPKRKKSLQKRVDKAIAEKKESEQKERDALLRAEVAERELKRVEDEKAFLLASAQKAELEAKENELSQRWTDAHEAGDSEQLQAANRALHEISSLKKDREREIAEIADKYVKYQEEEKQELDQQDELKQRQYEALVEFSDKRELNSPLYEGFLEHHGFLNPFDENYDARLVERVEPVKYDLIQELKINGEADVIGTKDFFEELSARIHQNLNPRLQQRENAMSYENDPRYQQPNYKKIQQQYQQPQYQQRQQQVPQQPYYPPQQQQYQQPYPPQQQGYQQPYYGPQQYPQQTVAPVNRAGYSTNYSTDPRDIQLDEQQKDVVNDLFLPALQELSHKVYGRTIDSQEAEDLYKRNLVNPRR